MIKSHIELPFIWISNKYKLYECYNKLKPMI